MIDKISERDKSIQSPRVELSGGKDDFFSQAASLPLKKGRRGRTLINMDGMIDPERFGLVYALAEIRGGSLFLTRCNKLFTRISGLNADDSLDVSDLFFGGDKEKQMRRLSLRREMVITFLPTGKSVRARLNHPEEGKVELVGINYTAFRKEQELFAFRTIGYRQFIDNFHGIAFQRMLKPETHAVFTTGPFEALTGYSGNQAKDLASWLEIVHPDDRERMREVGRKLYKEPGVEMEVEYRIIRKDGEVRWVRSYDSHFLSSDGAFEMVQGLIVDVTGQKRQEEKIREQNRLLEEMSMTDHMTGLSNRRFMQQVLGHYICHYRRSERPFSLLMIDLDNFKSINDRYGHDCGDTVIIRMASILRETLRETDIKARWGGEEFLVLLPAAGEGEALSIAGKLLDLVRREVVTCGTVDMRFTFSCGIAVYEKKISQEVFLKWADKALYAAKNSGRNRISLHKE